MDIVTTYSLIKCQYLPDFPSSENGPDPEALNWLLWIRNPTVQNLAKLRRAIENNDSDWMREFLQFDGLGLLFQVSWIEKPIYLIIVK